MAITTDVSTSIGKVRLEIGDRDTATGMGARPDGTNLTDDEITNFLTAEGSVRGAAARACEALAADWRKIATLWIGTRKEEAGAIADGYAAQAQLLRGGSGGGLRIRRLARPASITNSEYT